MESYLISGGGLREVCIRYVVRTVYKYFEPAAWFLRFTGRSLLKLGAFFLHPEKRQDFYEDRFFEQQDKKTRFLSQICGLDSLHLVEKLYPQPLAKDNMLTKMAANTALAEVEVVLRLCLQRRQSNAFRVVGINRGGVVVAEFLSKELGLDANVFMSVPDSQHLPDFSGLSSYDIYLVDDIVRTGETINTVQEEIASVSDSCNFFKISLVSSSDDVDYCAWLSNNDQIDMPWTSKPHGVVLKFEDYFDNQGIEQLSESFSSGLQVHLN